MLAIIGYILTLFMAFTFIPLFAFLVRLLLIVLFTRIYWMFSADKSPLITAKFSVKLAQPLGFLTAILHGYLALWMGTVLLSGMGAEYDMFLGIFLVFCFIWFGMKAINKPANISINGNDGSNPNGLTFKNGDPNTIVLNPEVNSIPEDGIPNDPSQNLSEQLQKQLKEQAASFMQGNSIVGLIGKVTGTVIATMSMIPIG